MKRGLKNEGDRLMAVLCSSYTSGLLRGSIAARRGRTHMIDSNHIHYLLKM